MAQEYYFFDSTKDDIRRYQARHLAEILDTVLQTGLLHKDGTPTIRVVANTKDMKVRVTAGKAVIKGHLYINTDDMTFDIPKTETIKRIVLRLDKNIDNRYIQLFLTEGDKNFPKPLERNNNIHELALCNIVYDANKGYIEQSDILDTRFDENLCGLAHSLITVPTTEYQKEWNEFTQRYETWFNEHKNSSYATLDYVKRNDDALRDAIAQLQLGGGGSGGGIEGGNSFATDFNEYSNTSLKTFKATTTTIGSNYVNVDKTVTGVKAGDELTVYDGTKQERKKVSSVSSTRINFTSIFTKSFKVGALVAASMGVVEASKKQYSFSGWGNTVEVQNETITKTYSASNVVLTDYNYPISTEEAVFIPIQYYKDNAYAREVLIVNIRKREITTVKGDGLGFTNGTGVYIYNTENKYIYVYNKDGSLSTQRFNDALSDELVRNTPIFNSKGLIHVRYYGIYTINDNATMTLKFKSDGEDDGRIHLQVKSNTFLSEGANNGYIANGDTLHKNIVFTFNTRASRNAVTLAYIMNKPYLIATPRDSSGFITFFDVDEIGGYSEYLQWLDFEPVTTSREEYILNEVTYTNADISKGDAIFNGTIEGVDQVWYISSSGDRLYYSALKSATNGGKNLLGVVSMEQGGNYKPFDNIQSMYVGKTSNGTTTTISLKINGVIGSGSDLLSNDLRLTLPNSTKGISLTVTATNGVAVTASFGGVELDKIVLGDRTQFAGVSSSYQNEITLKMERNSTSLAGGITKVVGGTEV